MNNLKLKSAMNNLWFQEKLMTMDGAASNDNRLFEKCNFSTRTIVKCRKHNPLIQRFIGHCCLVPSPTISTIQINLLMYAESEIK